MAEPGPLRPPGRERRPGVAGGRGRSGPGRGGAPGGRGGLVIGGRGARAQSPYQGSTTYTFGGSIARHAALSAAAGCAGHAAAIQPEQLRRHVRRAGQDSRALQNANRRTNFQFNYTGNRSNNLFNQYATVPTDAMRPAISRRRESADRSAHRPAFRQQSDSRQPDRSGRLGAARYMPRSQPARNGAELPRLDTSHSTSDSFSLRLTQNLSPTVAQAAAAVPRRKRGGPGAGFGGWPRRQQGRGGAAPTIMLSARCSTGGPRTTRPTYSRTWAAVSTSTSITIADRALNIVQGAAPIQNVNVNLTHADARRPTVLRRRERVGGGRHPLSQPVATIR